MWIGLGTYKQGKGKAGRKEEEKVRRESERLTPPGKEDLFVRRLHLSFVLFPCYVVPLSFFLCERSLLPPSHHLTALPSLNLLSTFIINWLSSSFILTSIHPTAGDLHTFCGMFCAMKGNSAIRLPPHILLQRFCCCHVIRLVSITGERFQLPTCVSLRSEPTALTRSVTSNRTWQYKCCK